MSLRLPEDVQRFRLCHLSTAVPAKAVKHRRGLFFTCFHMELGSVAWTQRLVFAPSQADPIAPVTIDSSGPVEEKLPTEYISRKSVSCLGGNLQSLLHPSWDTGFAKLRGAFYYDLGIGADFHYELALPRIFCC